jgi:hydrogenase maturation protease
MTHTLVLGIGNTLLMDEGVGVHVVEYLARHHPDVPGAQYLDGGTLSFTLAPDIEAAERLIVVDSAQLHAAAGTLKLFMGEDMDRFLGAGKLSVHEVSLMDLLDMVRLTERFPSHRALIAIQPGQIDWGPSPTPPVRKAIPRAAEQALRLIRTWSPDPL